MTPLFRERWWPYACSIIITFVWYLLGAPFPPKPDALMGASGTVAAVLVGFLGTAKAIVLSVSNSDVFKRIKESGYSDVLFWFLFESLTAGTVFLVISIIGFFVPEHSPNLWFSILWVLSGTTAMLVYSRTTYLLFKLVRQA